ncbi:AsmA-like C-terminal region-containing protein [Methyloraptor flagellatus]|uniref:AsmA-like C-terminal region-containing protein n=1 Tax=Methyloraptor flagellatus TaxID=3162530 RepID=A0AAU7XFG3_9HYPH
MSGAWPRLAFAELAGHAADTEVSGALGVDFAALPVAVSGRIGLGEVDLAGLAELGLGSGPFEAPLKAGEIWSGQPLGAPILGRSVRLDLDLTADRALIGPYRLDRAGLRLSTRVDEVGLEGLKAAFGPGSAAGTLRIKRASNGETTVSGDVKLAGIALEDIVWRRDGRSVATGRLDLDATFEGGGRSLAAVAAGLNGGGAVRVTAGVLRYVNPDAFRAIIVAADGGLDLKEDRVRTVFQSYLDNGQMPFDRLDAAFSMAGGVARAGEAVVESAGADARLGGVRPRALEARCRLDADGRSRQGQHGDGRAGAGRRRVLRAARPAVAAARRRAARRLPDAARLRTRGRAHRGDAGRHHGARALRPRTAPAPAGECSSRAGAAAGRGGAQGRRGAQGGGGGAQGRRGAQAPARGAEARGPDRSAGR